MIRIIIFFNIANILIISGLIYFLKVLFDKLKYLSSRKLTLKVIPKIVYYVSIQWGKITLYDIAYIKIKLETVRLCRILNI